MTPVEELFERKVFSNEVLILDKTSIVDFKFDLFLNLFFDIKKKHNKNTEMVIADEEYQFLCKNNNKFENVL